MKPRALILAGLLLPLLAGCGRESLDSLRKQQAQTVKDAADTLAAARDSATAEAARPKLKGVAERWRGIEKRQGELPVPTPEQAAELQRKHEAETTAARQRFAEEAVRVAALSGGKETLDEAGDILKSCGLETQDALRKQQLATVKEAADLLGSIKDKGAAEAAKPRLKQLGDRWRELKKAEGALPKATPDQEVELRKRYEDEAQGLKVRFGQQYVRVMTVPGGLDALREAGDIRDR